MKPLLIATVVLGSAGAGFGIGYKVAYRRLELEFERRLERETAGMREFYETVKQPYATPQEAAAELIKEDSEEGTAEQANDKVAYHKIVKKEYRPEEVVIPEELHENVAANPDVVETNLFQNDPVLISQEEFMQNDSSYIQGQLTYYLVDKVLTDEKDDVIEDLDATIGIRNLETFGHPSRSLSSDPNVIHVRNGRLQMEFEVCLSQNSYRFEVLGIEEAPPELPSGRKRS